MSRVASGVWSEWVAACASCHSWSDWQDELCPQLPARDSFQQFVVLKLFERQYSALEWVLSVYQIRTPVIQSGRQAGMAIAYRKFVVGEDIFEA